MMLIELYRYIRERFPLTVTMPLTAIFCGVVILFYDFTATNIPVIYNTCLLGIFIIRLADDIADFDNDKITHPERVLVRSARLLPRFKLCVFLLTIAVVMINIGSIISIRLISGTGVLYAVFYRFREYLHIILRPLFVNVIFFVLPVYVAVSINGAADRLSVFMGLYIWTGTLAHDFSHSIEDKKEEKRGVVSLTSGIGAERCAVISAILYCLDIVIAVYLWYGLNLPAVFIISQGVMTLYIIILLFHLIRKPDKATARPFYIRGFLFFLVPLASVIIHKLI